MRGTIFDIRKFSINDGPGIRTTVFLKGCPLRCAWCHNPESQSFAPEFLFWQSRCQQCGECLPHCPHGAILALTGVDGETRYRTRRSLCLHCRTFDCIEPCASQARELVGRSASVEEVLAVIERDRHFYEESGGGVTISGGEPLAQPAFTTALLRACRERDLHTALDTCGYAQWSAFEQVIPHTSLFLFDLKHLDDATHRRWTGVSNARILRNLRRLAGLPTQIHLRLPLAPGVNDSAEHLSAVARLAAGYPAIQRIDLLPYHASAAGKYARLDRPYAMPETATPTPAAMQQHAAIFHAHGLTVQVGG